ncbi:MAG: AAA family ATPase [Chloroflexi bacterium]|nr:AAA family ATPase [Chloroflexota bacterium]
MNCPVCQTPNPLYNKYCRECGAAISGIPTGEAERRLVTVMFADMSGSTAMSEKLDPEEVQELMNNFFQALAGCVHRYGGTVDKFLGDGIMALFGAPFAHEDDPERAVASALEMRESLRALNERFAHRLPQAVTIHIGINTGVVIAGRVGDQNRSDYTVLGDPVNVAARLEDKSEDGQILVAKDTFELTKHAFSFKELESVRVKGKGEPVQVWEVRGRRARRQNRRDLSGLRARLIGRDDDLGRLNDAIARLEAGSGGFVAVSGAAGVGKTRLMDEAQLAAALRNIKWAKAACPSLGLGGSLAVWFELMRRLLGLDDSRSRRSGAHSRTSGIRSGPTTRIISLDDSRDASRFLAQLLMAEQAEDERRRIGAADDETMRNRLTQSVRDAIESEAKRQPVVLLIDDLHWADSASMQLLARVLELTSRAPLLVMTAFRSDAATVRGPLDEAVRRASPPLRVDIELQSLDDEDSAALAEALLNGNDAHLDEIRALLTDSSGGNPLFMEEVLRSLEAQGVVRPGRAGWVRTEKAGTVIVPDSLKGLLLDRIDRLPESSKRLVQIAAVIGRAFPSPLLREIVLGAGSDIASLLATLEQASIVEQAMGPATADYRFRHALMQEAAYASLLHKHRAAYHRRVAEWYERLANDAEPPPEIATVLAHHYERAEVWNKAALWALRAADDERHAFALDEARDLYNRALLFAERASEPDVRRGARAGLGEIAVAEGAPDTALEHFAAALALAVDPLDRAVLERRAGQVHDREGRHALALAAFSRATEVLGEERPGEPADWTGERARLRVARAFAHLNRGDEEAARQIAQVALRADLPSADRADVTALLGATALRRGDAAEAAVHFEEALNLARDAGDLLRTASLLERLASAHRHTGQYDAARRALDECLAVRRRLGDDSGCGNVLVELAALDEHEGLLVDAVHKLTDAVGHANTCDEPVIAARAHLRLGRVLRDQGDWAGSRAAFERAGSDDPEAAGRVSLEVAFVDVAMRRFPEGELRAVLQTADRHGIADLAAQARVGLATMSRRKGRRDEARAYLRGVLVNASGSEDETTTAARLALAELTAEEGKPDVAVTSARLALQSAEKTGPAALVWKARRLLGAAIAATGARSAAEEQLRMAAEPARSALAYPELARCLGEWAAIREQAPSTPGPAPAAMRAEAQTIAAYLTGSGPAPDITRASADDPTPQPAAVEQRPVSAG